MLSFENDYSEGAHEVLLKRLCETNREQAPGYGNDSYCESAKQKIRAACGCPEADIYFLMGGTQTNMLVIGTMLKPYEGVIAADTGHVNVHEAGAIEYTGHKVLSLPGKEGKLEASAIGGYLESFYQDPNHEHMVFPGMVYISHPTEYGTLYTKKELQALREVCTRYGMTLYMDGARLGYGLASRHSDVSLPEIAALCDVFYIGGTKVGALCGEALVFTKNNTPAHFITQIKRHGAMLAKGRLPGIQFDALFTDDLYMEIGRQTMEMAEYLAEGLARKGFKFFQKPQTNQLLVIMRNEEYERLSQKVRVCFWEKVGDDRTVVRLAVSWATTRESIDRLLSILVDKSD